jgi:hypothetical protein
MFRGLRLCWCLAELRRAENYRYLRETEGKVQAILNGRALGKFE